MYVALSDIDKHIFSLTPGDRVFLRGVPGAGKTTFIQALIRHHMGDKKLTIVSPTYTYYQKYGKNLYHFDLYRATCVEDIIRIGADEILENPENICLIEWPDILEDRVQPTQTIDITLRNDKRYFEIHDVKTDVLT
ncbi:MAG: tRNA (adenosine(37)-N6)-threonylcarbamoyltransferase complex ATPase subunit type 1 TsaE [Candidatus Gracilibacteria bacterium]